MNTRTSVITVVTPVSRRVGQTTFATSARTCWRNVNGFVFVANVISSNNVRVKYRITLFSNSNQARQAFWTLNAPQLIDAYLLHRRSKCKMHNGFSTKSTKIFISDNLQSYKLIPLRCPLQFSLHAAKNCSSCGSGLKCGESCDQISTAYKIIPGSGLARCLSFKWMQQLTSINTATATKLISKTGTGAHSDLSH